MQRLPESDYCIDPEDPRAPPPDVWERMRPEQRARVVAMLPADLGPELMPPEGDLHSKATTSARSTLDAFFRRIGRRLYISSNLAVYYPGERAFAPDVIAVRDVEPHDRQKWVVATEGKGLELAIEVRVSGDRRKDEVHNVERYAALGIEEYFTFDRGRRIVLGYRLPGPHGRGGLERRAYLPILPQEGRLASAVLGLELMVEGDRLRFLYGGAPVPEADELIARLGSALNEAIANREEAERRAEAEASRAEQLEKELAEAKAEIERLRRS